MKTDAPIVENEEERLKTFREYNLEQLVEEDEFRALTELASRISNMPMALINLMALAFLKNSLIFFLPNMAGTDGREHPQRKASALAFPF